MVKKGSPVPKVDSSQAGNGRAKVAWKGYVNWQLTEAHKRAFAEFDKDPAKWDDMLVKATLNGYDLKVRYDERNDCLSAQLYCTNPNSNNAGWCLSMRASDWWLAVRRVLYVHFIALSEIWSEQGLAGWTDENW